MAFRTTARMTAFSPGQSPPPVSTPMRTADMLITIWFVPERDRLVPLGAAAAVAAAGAGASVLVQRRHTRRIAEDPERAVLEASLDGRPLTVTSSDGTELHVEVFGAKG